MTTATETRATYYTDSADKYGMTCPCGGTILALELEIDDEPFFSSWASKCYGCGKTEARRVTLHELPEDAESAFLIPGLA